MPSIKLGYNAVPRSARALVRQVWLSGQFSPGPMVREFEKQFASAHGAKHAVFVNSGTDALRLSLLALKEKYGWKDGDSVFVPTITFVATINAVLQAKLAPVFVDVGFNGTMNIEKLEWFYKTSVYDDAKALMLVHMFGARPDFRRAIPLAKKHNLKIIEDSCETLLNPLQGSVSCHSTYMAHHLTTGVGGFAVMNDDGLNLLTRSYANHGRNTDYLPGYCKGTDIRKRFRFDRIGYSCRGTEFEAALGLAQMNGLKRHIARRREIAMALYDALDAWEFNMQNPYADPSHTFMMYPIIIKENSKIRKYHLCNYLERHGIETRDMMPITTQPCYQQVFNKEQLSYHPMAELINKNGFYIPCHPGMTKKDVHYIKQVFNKYLK